MLAFGVTPYSIAVAFGPAAYSIAVAFGVMAPGRALPVAANADPATVVSATTAAAANATSVLDALLMIPPLFTGTADAHVRPIRRALTSAAPFTSSMHPESRGGRGTIRFRRSAA